jgi:AcrR family transcriptional regulator
MPSRPPWIKLNAAFHNRAPVVSGQQSTPGQRRGRPPSAAAHRAVLNAARELLGHTDLTHLNLEHVAAQAHVSKATIYRHWPTREALALEVLTEMTGELSAPDRGDTRVELIAMLEGTLRILTQTQLGSLMQGMFSELATNPTVREPFRAHVVAARRAAVAEVFGRGIQRGQIRRDADIDVATELLVGPVYYRMLFGGQLAAEFAQRVVDAVLAGYATHEAQNDALPDGSAK